MPTSKNIPPRIRLSFNDTNILSVNLRDLDQASLISRLNQLKKNTEDPRLITELDNLSSKITALTPPEFEQLRLDLKTDKIMFNPEYILPSF